MTAPRSEKALPAMLRLYHLALRLYPAAFRNEYGEEMQAIFRLRLDDAASKGRRAVLAFTCKEAIAFPKGAAEAHAQAKKNAHPLTFILTLFNWLYERGSAMPVRQFFPKSSEKTPWWVAILSLVPLLLPGPLATLLNYHPWWNPNDVPFINAARVPLTVSLIVLGFIIGAVLKFPRWSYIYSVFILLFIPLGLIALVNRFVVKINPDFHGYILIILLALIVLASRYLPVLRPFFSNIRQDWTLLSYAFYACAFFAFASPDRDESPVYNLQVLLPGVIAWLGALAYLRLADPVKKVSALVGAVLLGVLISLLPTFSGNVGSLAGVVVMIGMLLLYWVVLGGLVLVPLLFYAYSRPRNQPVE